LFFLCIKAKRFTYHNSKTKEMFRTVVASSGMLTRFCAGGRKSVLASSSSQRIAKRFLTAEAKKDVAQAAPAASTSSGGFGKRISGFAFGVAFASVGFYYQLHQDVWSSTSKIEEALNTFQESSIEENSILRHRVAVLEKELAIIKAKR
jgi:hypothetical protein